MFKKAIVSIRYNSLKKSNFYYRSLSYTSERYPQVQRDTKFKRLNEDDISHFNSILSKDQILHATPDNPLIIYNEDWMKKYKGQSSLVLKPKTTTQVSQILAYCNKVQLAMVPQGGNTGLVGGSVPVFDEIILSLSNMNNIRSFDELTGVLKCDAGVILQNAMDYVSDKGHVIPLDLGAKGSCQMGGVVATNAGGLRFIKYGSLHGSVLGLEVVLPNGQILNSMKSLRKDNTGYDWKQLFIGSEGTLGIVTGVSILTAPKPKANNVAFLAVDSFSNVLEVFKRAKGELNEILSAFEFMDSTAEKLTEKYLPDLPFPLESDQEGNEPSFYVLIETSGSNKEHDDNKLES